MSAESEEREIATLPFREDPLVADVDFCDMAEFDDSENAFQTITVHGIKKSCVERALAQIEEVVMAPSESFFPEGFVPVRATINVMREAEDGKPSPLQIVSTEVRAEEGLKAVLRSVLEETASAMSARNTDDSSAYSATVLFMPEKIRPAVQSRESILAGEPAPDEPERETP